MTTRDVRFEALSAAHQEIAKNGADFLRLAEIVESGGGSDAADITVDATPVNYTAATGDVETHLEGIDTALGSLTSFSGARLNRSGGLSDLDMADFGASTNIPWDTVVYDVGGWADLVTDDEILTVPAGVSYVDVVALIEMNNAGAGPENFAGYMRYHNTSSSAVHVNDTEMVDHTTNPVYGTLKLAMYNFPVVEGGYFWCVGTASPAHVNDMVVNTTLRTSFSIQAVG